MSCLAFPHRTLAHNLLRSQPRRSNYAFCIDPKHAGYFYLCFKAGANSSVQSWSVKVIPQAFELQKHAYPDMRALCNGFKLLFQNMMAQGVVVVVVEGGGSELMRKEMHWRKEMRGRGILFVGRLITR